MKDLLDSVPRVMADRDAMQRLQAAHEKLGDDVKDTRKRLEAPPPHGGVEPSRPWP